MSQKKQFKMTALDWTFDEDGNVVEIELGRPQRMLSEMGFVEAEAKDAFLGGTQDDPKVVLPACELTPHVGQIVRVAYVVTRDGILFQRPRGNQSREERLAEVDAQNTWAQALSAFIQKSKPKDSEVLTMAGLTPAEMTPEKVVETLESIAAGDYAQQSTTIQYCRRANGFTRHFCEKLENGVGVASDGSDILTWASVKGAEAVREALVAYIPHTNRLEVSDELQMIARQFLIAKGGREWVIASHDEVAVANGLPTIEQNLAERAETRRNRREGGLQSQVGEAPAAVSQQEADALADIASGIG